MAGIAAATAPVMDHEAGTSLWEANVGPLSEASCEYHGVARAAYHEDVRPALVANAWAEVDSVARRGAEFSSAENDGSVPAAEIAVPWAACVYRL